MCFIAVISLHTCLATLPRLSEDYKVSFKDPRSFFTREFYFDSRLSRAINHRMRFFIHYRLATWNVHWLWRNFSRISIPLQSITSSAATKNLSRLVVRAWTCHRQRNSFTAEIPMHDQAPEFRSDLLAEVPASPQIDTSRNVMNDLEWISFVLKLCWVMKGGRKSWVTRRISIESFWGKLNFLFFLRLNLTDPHKLNKRGSLKEIFWGELEFYF